MIKKLRQQFADSVTDIGKKDKNLIVLVSDISHEILKPFANACPGRYYNLGICEQAIVNMAAGLKKVGFYPVLHTIAPFLIERCYEQIKLDFGYQNLGVNLVSVGGTYDYSKLGCSHHCYSDFALMNQFSNCNIIVPGSALEFKILFKSIYKKNKINYFRLTENPHQVLIKSTDIRFGRGIKIKKGNSLTLVAVGSKLKEAIQAYNYFASKKKYIEVLYYHTLKPFDKDLLRSSVKKNKRLLVIEEFSKKGGFFSECLNATKDIKNVSYENIGIDSFVHDYGTYDQLNSRTGLDLDSLKKKIFKIIK
jgi:transketolase